MNKSIVKSKLCVLPTQCDASKDGAKTATSLEEIKKLLIQWWNHSLSAPVIENDVIFSKELLYRENVAVIPGSSFGEKNSIRISYALNQEDIKLACKRIRNFCDSIT